MNDFRSDLAFSVTEEVESLWLEGYRRAFPGMLVSMSVPGDNEAQRRGVDRVLFLSNCRTVFVDEKTRRDDWDDVLLEFISNDTTGTKGWIEKNLAIDYLAYLFLPTRRISIYPWPMLKSAWLRCGHNWKTTRKIPPAQNDGYSTHSVAVPAAILRAEIMKEMLILL